MNREAKRKFTGIWIPRDLWLSELKPLEMCALVEIDSLDNGEAGCFASNSHLCKFLGISLPTLKRVLQTLEDGGFIYREGSTTRRKIRSNLAQIFTKSPPARLKNEPNLGSEMSHIDIQREIQEEGVEEPSSNGHHTTRSFTAAWLEAGGEVIRKLDYGKVKKLVEAEDRTEVDRVLQLFHSPTYGDWFTKDGKTFPTFFTHYTKVATKNVPRRRVRFCPKCGSGGQRLHSGGRVECLTCHAIYEAEGNAQEHRPDTGGGVVSQASHGHADFALEAEGGGAEAWVDQ